ncbi:MAG: hypothetical protein ABR577_17680 [Pyrinomonadaceae bacterium]
MKMLPKLRQTAFFVALLTVACGAVACTGNQLPANNAQSTTVTNSSTTQSSSQTATTPQSPGGETPLASAHGGAGLPPGGGSGAKGSADTPEVETAALDAKIEQAERKAKAPNAGEADKHAAAAAYLERGNVYYNAGRPSLYKFALRDLRRVLRYEPDNADAREKVDTIVTIYQSMNRPVPELGNEP